MDVVIDIGMNIGDFVLYFLNDPRVAKVFAFELFREIFLRVEESIWNNNIEQDRVCLFPYGLKTVRKNELSIITGKCPVGRVA